MKRRLSVRRWLSVGVLLTGLVVLAQGLWIPAKAALAQQLLERAFDRVLAGHGYAPPWPWADGQPLARLSWDRQGIHQIVLGQASGRTLAFAPGHVPPSALPGQTGHIVISAHRDTHFAFLGDLEPGDELLLEYAGGQRRYRMTDSQVLDLASQRFDFDPERHRLTLVTCFPLDGWRAGTTQRLLVHLDPVST